jgi:hypothetical protein
MLSLRETAIGYIRGWELVGVNLVGVDIFSECLVDGLVEAGKQLEQGFSSAATDQHGQAIMSVGGGGGTTNGGGTLTVISP